MTSGKTGLYDIIDLVIRMILFQLGIQTGYSFNGSLIDPSLLAKKAAELGYRTIGIADTGTLHAAIKFYRACHEAGIQGILGVRIWVIGFSKVRSPLLAYARNNVGYQNLMRLSSRLNTEGKELSMEDVVSMKDGVAFVTPPDEGEFMQAAMMGDLELGIALQEQYRRHLIDWRLGIDLSDFSIEARVAPFFEKLGDTIIVNKAMYWEQSDKAASTILARILHDSTPTGLGFFGNEDSDARFLRPSEMTSRYQDYADAALRTEAWLKDFSWTVDFSTRHLPKYPVEQESAMRFLSALAKRGLERRYAQTKRAKAPFDEYKKRLEFELSVIQSMGYEDYFLIVWDFVLYAKKAGILVGPGRGSAAGSLTSYVLGIVDVDPIEHHLFFERFLNPERITMPDIDMDFPDDRRDEVIQYVVQKYGKNHVTNIVAFGTFQGKSAVRDVGRILGLSDVVLSELSDALSKSDNSIDQFETEHPDVFSKWLSNPQIAELIGIAKKLIDLPKHISTHAAGIIITDQDITTFSPVQNGLLSMYQTQYEASDLELLGLNKIDFLGIRNLKTIQRVIELVKEQTNQTIDIYRIPMDDKKTFSLLQQVQTLGIFQLESDGMMNLLRRMQLKDFEDISLCIALFRPGPMENIPMYLRRRFGEEQVAYPHPTLQTILIGTKGVIVYQEQIMQIARDFAGYTLGEADVLRRAVSKKNEATLQKERKNFVAKAIKMGRDEATADVIYDTIVKFANYGFNKSHSVAYALVAYWMAYLKANYSDVFMAVLMDSVAGSQGATAAYMRECRRLGIRIYPPSINRSKTHYVSEQGNLRYPFLGIRAVGLQVALRLEELLKQGPVLDFLDFMKRAKDINVRVVENLIMVGVFDEFGHTKKTLMENLKSVQSFVAMENNSGEHVFRFLETEEYSFDHLQAAEKDLLGIHLKYHPVMRFEELAKQRNYVMAGDVDSMQEGIAEVVGMAARIKTLRTKRGETMAFLEIEDAYGKVDAVLFPENYQRYQESLKQGEVAVFRGMISLRNETKQLVIDRIVRWKEESL